MTVENQTYKVVAEGNGSGFTYSFSPMVLPTDEDDLEVTLTDADGVDTTLTRGSGASNYSVSVSSFPGTGSITYPADSSTALPSGQYLTMKRVLVLEQAQDIENQGGYSPETLETTLDKLVMIALQQQEELDFSFKTSLQDSTAIGRLPNAATRASKYLFFDASGDPQAVTSISNVGVSVFMGTLLDDTTATEGRTTLGAQEDVITTRGDIVVGNSTPAASRLAIGAANTAPVSDGTDLAYQPIVRRDIDSVFDQSDNLHRFDFSNAAGDNEMIAGLADFPDVSTAAARVRLLRNTNTSGNREFTIYKGDGTATESLTLDPANDVLQLGGENVLLTNVATAQATTSGTAFSFVCPFDVMISATVNFLANSLAGGTDTMIVQLGTGGGPTYVTSGYVGTVGHAGGNLVWDGDGAEVTNDLSASHSAHGSIIITAMDLTAFVYSIQGAISTGVSNRIVTTAGAIDLAALATAVRLTRDGTTDAFDAGSVSVTWTGYNT